jgi:hypothetical protein
MYSPFTTFISKPSLKAFTMMKLINIFIQYLIRVGYAITLIIPIVGRWLYVAQTLNYQFTVDKEKLYEKWLKNKLDPLNLMEDL